MDEDILQPADLRPAPPPSAPPPPRRFPPLWLGGLLLLLLGLGTILWLRSRLPDTPPPRPDPTPVPATPTPDPTERLEAEAALNALIPVLRDLRPTRPELWAPEAWQDILSGQQAGNTALAERRYGPARDAYQAARADAERLTTQAVRAPDLLATLAQQAYEEGYSTEAVAALKALLSLRPGDADAAQLLPRARVADQSRAALQEARAALANNDAPRAWLAAQRLEQLDAEFPGGGEVREQIRSVLDAESGRAALLEERRNEQIRRAEALEASEDWEAATEAWLRVPESIPEGRLERLREWAEWEERMRRAGAQLRSTQAHQLEEELDAARLADFPPGLAAKARAFLNARERNRRPVSVRLISDGETTVRIQRVRDFAPFGEQRINLPPGTYTAIGHRMGYRDVRHTFTLAPGAEEFTLDIRTTEALNAP